jgi:hypothetical protein
MAFLLGIAECFGMATGNSHRQAIKIPSNGFLREPSKKAWIPPKIGSLFVFGFPRPRVEQSNLARLKIGQVSCDDSHSMHQRSCRYQSIPDRPRIGNMKSCATLRHGKIDRQDAAGKCRYDVAIQPYPEHSALRGVATLRQ